MTLIWEFKTGMSTWFWLEQKKFHFSIHIRETNQKESKSKELQEDSALMESISFMPRETTGLRVWMTWRRTQNLKSKQSSSQNQTSTALFLKPETDFFVLFLLFKVGIKSIVVPFMKDFKMDNKSYADHWWSQPPWSVEINDTLSLFSNTVSYFSTSSQSASLTKTRMPFRLYLIKSHTFFH